MDPHSRLNQFNVRGTRAEPPPPSRSSTSNHLVRRPIATNARIKQNESYRKDMYLAFVNNALQEKITGNSQPFDELVNQFNPKRRTDPSSADSSTSLRTWILALTHVVSRLERPHSNLVEAIVNMPWTTLDSATVKSYTVFTGMLLSARPEYLSLVLGKIAQGFTYHSGLSNLSQVFPESSASPVTRRVIYDRLHYLLQHLLSLIPTLPSTLHPLLVRNFPHKRQSQLTQTTYIRNLLRVSSYCPELLEKILATIVDRIIQIDVEIQVELEEFEQEEILEEQPLFDIDPIDAVVEEDEHESDLSGTDDSGGDETGDDFSDLSSDAGGVFDDEMPLEIPTNVKHIQDMVKKLDAMLTLTFEHFQRTHAVTPVHPNSVVVDPQRFPSTPFRSSPPGLELPPLPPLPSDSPQSPPLTPFANPDRSHETSRRRLSTQDFPLTISTTTTPPVSDAIRTQFNALLSIFDRTILRTFKSRYTQFLIFWFTSLDSEFADIFQGMLVERALLGSSSVADHSSGDTLNQGDSSQNGVGNSSGSTITRAAAASYIGSFVSRAEFVDTESAKRVVAVLCEFLRAHLDELEDTIRTCASSFEVGGHHHTVFYAVTQAVFLIFCFRWRDLLVVGEEEDPQNQINSNETLVPGDNDFSGKGQKWIPELGVLQRVITSVLNPLRVCSPNVVMQFARVAQATDFVYCYTILESNKRLEHTDVSTSNPNTGPTPSTIIPALNRSDLGSVTAELNTFFPFDPYRLPRSSVFIRDVYREWSSVAIGDGSDDEESDEEGVEEGKEYSGAVMRVPPAEGNRTHLDVGEKDETTGGLGASLEQMSISPIPRGVFASA